jgi:hypothetical protein
MAWQRPEGAEDEATGMTTIVRDNGLLTQK